MSIFGKDCPRCGETNAAYAVSCRCGFAFNSVEHAEEEQSDISVTIQEEELYLEYLTARAQQAADTAKRAASAAAAQPANRAAASQSQQAQRAAEQAKADLEQQRACMKTAMNALADDRPAESEQPTARPEQPASAPPAPSQSPALSATSASASAPAKAVTTPPVGERKQPTPVVPKPAAPPSVAVERKEPASATVKSSAPAVKHSEPTPPGASKTPQDLNKYVPGPDNACATTTSDNAGQVTGHPVHKQTKMPTAHAGTQPETKVQASALSTANKVVAPTAKTNAAQAVPTKPQHVPADKQPPGGSASTTTGSAPPGNDAGAEPQVPRAADLLGKPATQGDAVTTKATAAAARAKQLAEALKAAQAERAARMKTSTATPNPAHNEDDKAGQEKPVTSAASTAKANPAPAPVQTPKAAEVNSAPGVTVGKRVNGQQQKPNGPAVDINAIHIPGTEPRNNKPASDEAVPERASNAPATAAKQSDAATRPSSDNPMPKVKGAPRPRADSKAAAAAPPKPAPGVTVTAAPGANPQEELEAALKALSGGAAPAPPASKVSKAPADAGDAGTASPEIGNSPAPAVTSTPAPDELPSLEPVPPANQKDCPNCTAWLPMDAKRCRCGFRFPEVEETMPGLSLSDSDFAALDGDTSSAGITHLS